jgi:hypothetical protein
VTVGVKVWGWYCSGTSGVIEGVGVNVSTGVIVPVSVTVGVKLEGVGVSGPYCTSTADVIVGVIVGVGVTVTVGVNVWLRYWGARAGVMVGVGVRVIVGVSVGVLARYCADRGQVGMGV